MGLKCRLDYLVQFRREIEMDYESQLKVGQYAEICKWEERSSSSWIEAKILDIEWANGKAQFNISFIDENGKIKNLIIDEDYAKRLPFDENGPLIRPRPPSKVYCISENGESVAHPLFKDNWQAGDAVEVHYGNCWRPGRVVEMSCTNEKMIYFYNGSNIKVDSSMEIRAQVTWTGKSWFLVNNETPQIGAKGSFNKKFKPYVGEGLLSPNREIVTKFVRDIFTEHPSFARAIQRKCLGRNGKMSFPVMFMTNYLSGSQGTVTFEDSDGLAWTVGWSAYMQSGRRLVFTTGWPEFASDHNANEGDVLLVEILNPNRFRVQILPTESGMYTNENVLCERAVTQVHGFSTSWNQHFFPAATLVKKEPINASMSKHDVFVLMPPGGGALEVNLLMSSFNDCGSTGGGTLEVNLLMSSFDAYWWWNFGSKLTYELLPIVLLDVALVVDTNFFKRQYI